MTKNWLSYNKRWSFTSKSSKNSVNLKKSNIKQLLFIICRLELEKLFIENHKLRKYQIDVANVFGYDLLANGLPDSISEILRSKIHCYKVIF